VPSSEIDSDVQDWSKHPAPEDEHPLVVQSHALNSQP